MSGDNGGLDKVLAKADKFSKDPDRFIDLDEVICCAKKMEDGTVGIAIGQASRSQFIIAKSEIDYRLHATLDFIEAKMAQERSKIIKPQGNSIMNFVRGGKK